MSNNENIKEYSERDEAFMKKAIELLSECPECEVPVAAIIVCDGEIVGRGVNRRETDSDPTAHAEVVAIRDAANKLGRWNLSGCELFVTLEPCVMCGGAIVYSRISRVVFGAYDLRFGACGTALDVVRCDKLNHRAEVVGGVLDKECLKPITDFFKARRK
ncbi:MAG: tRNA adenosine(34) deaminase TadA [Clostridiales bacterium]|nr:tRNA adenosine(34) deaminase TadA [Clostridiales bacterium]